jgi:hypothetical protein
MKHVLLLILLCLLPAYGSLAYPVLYAEQFYRLYHEQLHMSSDEIMENIVWLERALAADFGNPLYALARIENERQWERYRNLFRLHVNLKILEMHLRLGSRYDKRVAYFYNAPWKEQNLESLRTAEALYETARYYWNEALRWARRVPPFGPHLEDVQAWEDEASRMRTGELDYAEIIDEQVARLRRVRATFEAMDENTY